MIKVLLVDDEPNVRHGVRMMIPWDELGLTVIGEGEDGDDGLAKMMSLNPDIVIADVKMPGMTGIQMIEAAINSGYSGKCLILSGYSDFTYAKEAMSFGVKRFILKPVDEDELIEALKSMRDEIAEERKDELTMKRGSEYMNEKLVRALLLGDDSVLKKCDLSGYNYNSYCAVIICAASDMSAEDKNSLLSAIKRRMEGGCGADVITPEFSGMTVALVKGYSRSRIMDFLSKLYREYGEKIFITVGSNVSALSDIKRSYCEADALLKNRFQYLHCGVVASETVSGESGSENPENETEELVSQIYAYIEINDTEKLDAALDKFQTSLRNGSYTAERIKIICITTIMEIKSKLIKNIGEKKTEQFLSDEFIAKVGEKASLFDITELLKKTLSDLSCTHFGRTTKSNMERVVQYIQSNYNSELRLEILANIFGYNSAYLGKVFHQYTGENFNNYLDRIRITEAKRLLAQDGYKVYEVAEMVGYTNINYFHNKFKKYVGISPLNYKRQCRGENIGENDDSDDEE